ncbi:MAG: EAL domain-containing protein [Gammaproteobacteria bacterium]|nr:EAL domain-containing protein [Gammaproteobacteria bacterium]
MVQKDFSTYFNTGDCLFEEGDIGDFAYIIESGAIDIFHRRGTNKLVLSKLSEGDILGEMAIIDKLPRSATAQATEPTRVIAIPFDYVKEKIADSDPVIRLFLRLTITRYRDLHTRFTRVFDGIEDFNKTPMQSKTASATVEIENIVSQYQKIQQHLNTAVKSAPNNYEERLGSEQTLISTKLLLTQDKSIKSAMQDDEFILHYQPIIDLETSQIIGCEALIRWVDQSGSIIYPSEFIPRAEMSGLIVDLGYWIAKEACNFQKRLATMVSQPIFMSINLSGKQFESANLVSSLADIMDQAGVTHSMIKYEITESLLMDNPELTGNTLHRLKETGVQLAIDDFGTGYSSFSYLHQLPFDTMKIDRSFVSEMVSNLKSNEIVKTLVHLSHDLGMNVIAEGIETKFEAHMLKQHRADYGQGHYFSRSLSGENFIQLVKKQITQMTGS